MSDADEQATAERIVTEMMSKDAFSQSLGMEIVEVRPRVSVVRMTVRDDMLNGFGVCHGGATFALADTALAFACNTHGRVTVAIENSITYPRAIAAGDILTATAEEESSTNRLGFYRVTVRRANGESVALFRGTVYKTNKASFPDIE
jgi:acyl-CoA thioesterase